MLFLRQKALIPILCRCQSLSFLDASRKLEAAEEKIADMKKGVWSYLKVCRRDRRDERLKEKRLKRERKERRRSYEEAERRNKQIIEEMRKSRYGRGV